MTSGTLQNQASADPTELEFALETQSGFLIVIKGTGNDGSVTLAVRRRVGTPPASAIAISDDEVRRLIAVLGELSPSAFKEKEKHSVVRQRDSYLDNLMGTHNEPENANLDLFIERDFPELANRRKRSAPTSILGIDSASVLITLSDAVGRIRVRPKQLAIAGTTLAVVVFLALSAVAVGKYASFLSQPKAEPVAVAALPTAGIEEFSKNFVIDMLTFKVDDYSQAQMRAMAVMTPDLAKKYWHETGFPLNKKQLRAIPQDQQVQVATVTALPISIDQFQVDVVGSVSAKAAAKTMPLHIRLTINKDGNKLTVTDQKDLSSVEATPGAAK